MAKVIEKADEQVQDSIRKITRAASAMAEAIDEGTDVISSNVYLTISPAVRQ
jgi:N-methylhydantoinase B/oxoprolinase/acetone carboxylase alpha subunit